MKRLCVFCGASAGNDPAYARLAFEAGKLLASRGIGLVYGGGNVGLMGALADGALSMRGEVIGVIPHALEAKELAHKGATEMRVVRSMHERKQLMHDLSDGFVALPGGLGTFDELFETLTWAQLGFHRKPVGLVNSRGYYDPLRALLSRAVSDGFVGSTQASLLLVEETLEALLPRMERWSAPNADRWLGRGEN